MDNFSILISMLPDIGASALLVLVVILILTGKLVPGREMRYWRDAFFEEQSQKRRLLQATKVTEDVLKALPEVAREDGKP